MAKYEVSIRWRYSVETMTLDVDDLPREGMEVRTTEVMTGEPEPLDYNVVVLATEKLEAACTLTLGYEESRNRSLEDRPATWGTSIIRVDLSADTPSATAEWRSDPEDATLDGTVRRITFTPLDETVEDLLALGNNVSTQKAVMVAARIGQGRFRSGVIAAWKGGEQCALTKIDTPEMLVASHIKPWRESTDRERLDPANGLLLATHVDRLFDRFLLSFKPDLNNTYVLQLHPRVRKDAGKLGLKEGQVLDATRLGPRAATFRKYMDVHYSRFLSLSATENQAA